MVSRPSSQKVVVSKGSASTPNPHAEIRCRQAPAPIRAAKGLVEPHAGHIEGARQGLVRIPSGKARVDLPNPGDDLAFVTQRPRLEGDQHVRDLERGGACETRGSAGSVMNKLVLATERGNDDRAHGSRLGERLGHRLFGCLIDPAAIGQNSVVRPQLVTAPSPACGRGQGEGFRQVRTPCGYPSSVVRKPRSRSNLPVQ
jgi:hypothetical protein